MPRRRALSEPAVRAQALFATDATTLALSVAPGLQLFGLAGSSASALQKPSVLFRRGSDPVCSPGTKCSGLREALMPRTRPGGNLSPLALCLVILNCISGTALLCVPWAFAQAGEVVAALTLLVLGLVSAWTGTELLCAASRLGARSMKEVVSLATGSWVLGKAAGASVAVILIGALCANAAFIGSAAADIRLALSGRRTTEAEAQGMVLCIAGTALVLGSAFTGQAAYSRAASLNPLGLLFLLGVVLVKCLDTLVLGVDRAAAAAGTAAHPAPVAVGSAPGMAPGVFLFAFMSHPVLIELASLLRPPREADGEGGGSPYTTPPHSPRLPPASPLSPPPKSPARAPYSPPPVEKKASPIVLPPGAPQLTVEVPTDDAMPALTDACCGAIGPKLAAAFAALPPAAPPLFVAYSINASVLLLVGTLGASALGERVAPNVLHEFASDGFALAASVTLCIMSLTTTLSYMAVLRSVIYVDLLELTPSPNARSAPSEGGLTLSRMRIVCLNATLAATVAAVLRAVPNPAAIIGTVGAGAGFVVVFAAPAIVILAEGSREEDGAAQGGEEGRRRVARRKAAAVGALCLGVATTTWHFVSMGSS